MRRSSMSLPRLAALSIGITLLGSANAAAQSPALASFASATAQASQPQPTPKGDVFAGVAFWNEEGSWPGFHVAGAYRPWRHVGFVGDVAFYAGGDGYEPEPTLMGGVRFYLPSRRVTIFAQFLVGSAPFDDFAMQPGFGVDVHLNRTVAIRVAGDFKVSGDDGSTYVGSRFSVGAAFGFGGK